MIALDSKSYPYLAIAQHYKISYAKVLKYSELIKGLHITPPYSAWRFAVWQLERDK